MDEKQALKSFYEQCGEKYPEEDIVYQTLRGRIRKQFILKHLRQFTGSLLEIGANRGMYLQAYDGGDRYGIDLSSSALKHAHGTKPMYLACCDAENLCLVSASVDNVLCSEVLEHCLNPQLIFDGMASVLKPGGMALLTTPNYTRKRPVYMPLGTLTDFDIDCDCGDHYFHTAYKPAELIEMAVKSGLTVIETGTLEKEVKYATKIPVILLLTCRSLNKLIRSKRFEQWNESFFQTFTNRIYDTLHFFKLNGLLNKMVPEGVRSYILMQK